MDQEKIKRILEVADQQDEIKLKVLHNAVIKCIKDYQNESTSARLNDWQKAEAALETCVIELSAKHFEGDDDRPLTDIAAVLKYLQAGDWRVTKTSLYRHRKEGKIAPRRDGGFAVRDIEKYARTWLKQKSTGKKLAEKSEEMQSRKLSLEISVKEEELKRIRFANERERGLYIPRSQVDLEQAALVGILDAALRNWVQAELAEWVRLVGGDVRRIGELNAHVLRGLDRHLNSLSRDREYDVVIPAEEAAEQNDGGGDEPDA